VFREFALELVDTLIRHPELSSGFRPGDRITPVEASTGQEHPETHAALSGDQLNILSDSIRETKSRLDLNSCKETVETVPQETAIHCRAGRGDLVHSRVALWYERCEAWIAMPDMWRPPF
jgi:hypothetical protein